LKVKKPTQKLDNIIGVDVGLKTFATLSDGTTIENPKILKKYQKKLVREQRRLSRRVKGSKNKEEQRLVVAKLHRKVRNVRRDFQHKTTHNMITKYDGFVLEDLNIKGMLKNHCLAK
jgi:putative transposase